MTRGSSRLKLTVSIAWLGVWLGVWSLPALGASAATCNVSPASAPAMSRLAAFMAQGRFVAYQPTSLQAIDGRLTEADPASIRADLKVLRPRFDGLITYNAVHGAEAIPAIAASLGFRAIIIGVWDPLDENEEAAALEAARQYPQLVLGISLGNETVLSKRRGFPGLAAAVELARRRAPQLPISTTEPFHLFYDPAAAPLLRQLDFLLVNVHPIFQPWFRQAPDSNAAQFVVNVVAKLAQSYCGPILVKETGEPTAPSESGFSEERQSAFYKDLNQVFARDRVRAFAYFSAFDAPWRAYDAQPVPVSGPHPEEAHWGLYDAQRKPKSVIAQIPPLK